MNINLFGKKSVASAIIASIITSIMLTFHSCGITENQIWKWYYEIKKDLNLKLPNRNIIEREIEKQLNQKLIEDPELLNYKVHKDVDDAIFEYERTISDYEVKFKPKYMNLKNDETLCYTVECKALAPPMRIYSPWVDETGNQ